MNYYIIPTKCMEIEFRVQTGKTKTHFLSDSFVRNVKSLHEQVNNFVEYYTTVIDKNMINRLYKINHMYSYVYDIITSNVKLYINENEDEINKNIFFIVIELANTFDFIYTSINHFYNDIIYIGDTPDIFTSCIQYMNKKPPGLSSIENVSINTVFDNINFNDKSIYNKYKGFRFFDIADTYNNDNQINQYIVYLLKIIAISIETLQPCIIKVWDITYLPVIEFVYLLSNIYNILYITKPTITQHIQERYLVCKEINNMYYDVNNRKKLYNEIINIVNVIEEVICENKNRIDTDKTIITSILNHNISYHFLNKIEESTLIIGQKIIEHNENIIILLKMYGKEEKIENVKKNSIIKCYQWCNKIHVPTVNL